MTTCSDHRSPAFAWWVSLRFTHPTGEMVGFASLHPPYGGNCRLEPPLWLKIRNIEPYFSKMTTCSDHTTEDDSAFVEILLGVYAQKCKKYLTEKEKRAAKRIFSDLNPEKEAVAENYDIISGTYDDLLNFLGYQIPEKIAQALNRLIPLEQCSEDMTLLDAGSGTGLLGELIRSMGFKGRLIGVDISPKSIQYLQQNRTGIYDEARVGDLTALPHIKDAAADVVASAGVIGIAPKESLDELLRITKPGGLLIYSFSKYRFDSDPSWEEKHRDFLMRKLWQQVEGYPGTYLFYDNEQLRISDCFYLFIFKKENYSDYNGFRGGLALALKLALALALKPHRAQSPARACSVGECPGPGISASLSASLRASASASLRAPPNPL